MAYERIRGLPQFTEPVCVHLRSKGMIVAGVANAAELGPEHGHHGCWCNLTQRGSGPDDRPAEVLDCTPSRSCFSAIR
jgi:hypothetical protein